MLSVLAIFCIILFILVQSYQAQTSFFQAQTSLYYSADDSGEAQETGDVSISPFKSHVEAVTSKVNYFATLYRIDPMFGLPGVREYQKIEVRLRESHGLITSLYTNGEKTVVEDALYPIDFTEDVVELETLRRAVVSQPSVGAIEAYHTQLHKTVESYTEYVHMHKKAIETLIDEYDLRYAHFNFPTGKVTANGYITFLEDLVRNAQRLDNKLKSRIECWQGKLSSCEDLSKITGVLMEGLSLWADSYRDEETPFEVTERVLRHKEFIDQMHNVATTSKQVDTAGVIFKLSNAGCFPDRDAFIYVFAPRVQDSAGALRSSPRTAYLNELYFIDYTGKFDVRSDQLFPFFPQNEVQYVFQELSNSYMCADSGRHITKAFSMWNAYNTLKEYRFFSDVEGHQALAILEDDILSAEVVTEGMLDTYVAEVAKALFTRETSLSPHQGEEWMHSLEAFILAYRNNLGGYVEAQHMFVLDNLFVTDVSALVGDPYGVDDLLLTRSNPAFTTFAYSSLVLPTKRPIASPQTFLLDSWYLTSYDRDLRTEFSIEEMVAEAQKYSEIKYRQVPLMWIK